MLSRRTRRKFVFGLLLGAFFIALILAGQSGLLCDPADTTHCIGAKQ